MSINHWDRRFLALALHVSRWSRDPSTQVGAVVVRPNRTIASIGFNGLPRFVDDTNERLNDRKIKNQMVVHAEANAILMAQESLEGYSIFVTHPPCASCAGMVIQSGIAHVVCLSPTADMLSRWGESFNLMQDMLSEADVSLTFADIDDIHDSSWREGVAFDCSCSCGLNA